MGRSARIKVIGVGGAGNNAVNRMIEIGMEGVEFVSVNTDVQSLRTSKAPVRVQIGSRLTRGLGAAANPETGRRAALEESGKIIEALEGADMVFITAGLGGGTGTGAAPVIASIANQMGALTVAVVTRPFAFEGRRRMNEAERGLEELLLHVDTLIAIPNEKLLAMAGNEGFFESFQMVDDVLRQAVQGISNIITIPGVINCDLADVKTTMAGMGYAVMGTAARSGPKRATEAAMAAISSPLVETGTIDGARGILINITGSSSLKLSEVNEASRIIQSAAHEDANIIFGAILDDDLGDELKITVIATGLTMPARGQVEGRAPREIEPVRRQVEQPTIFFEEPPQQTRYVPIRPLPPVPRTTMPVQLFEIQAPEAPETLKPAKEVEAFAEPVEKVPEEAPAEEAVVEAVAVEGPIETNSDFEEDLLAGLEGPAFDFAEENRVEAETEQPEIAEPNNQPIQDLSSQPERARVRHAAVAAYMAISYPEDVVEDVAAPEANSFAAMLESRQKLSEPEIDDPVEDEVQSVALEEAAAAEPVNEVAEKAPPATAPEPISEAVAPKEFLSILQAARMRSEAPPDAEMASDDAARGAPQSGGTSKLVEHEPRVIDRDAEFWQGWEPEERGSGFQARIPSFAGVSERQEESAEPDELDIPAFLRRPN